MREHWHKEAREAVCRYCKKDLAPHKIYYCSSACSWRWRENVKKKNIDYKAEITRMNGV